MTTTTTYDLETRCNSLLFSIKRWSCSRRSGESAAAKFKMLWNGNIAEVANTSLALIRSLGGYFDQPISKSYSIPVNGRSFSSSLLKQKEKENLDMIEREGKEKLRPKLFSSTHLMIAFFIWFAN